MQNLLETREGFAEMLQDLLAFAHVSNKEVARMMDVHERTVRNWLEGYSQPDPSTLIKLFRLLNVPMLPFIIDRNSASEDDRQAVIEYVTHVASASELRDMRYNLTVKHGSAVSSQLALVSMLNHMKLVYRLMIAKTAIMLWEIASNSDGLQHTDSLPDVDKVRSAIVKSSLALKDGKDSYTDI